MHDVHHEYHHMCCCSNILVKNVDSFVAPTLSSAWKTPARPGTAVSSGVGGRVDDDSYLMIARVVSPAKKDRLR